MILFIHILAKTRFISLTINRITTLIINRYLIAEIIKPLASMLAVLVIIFAAYSTNRYLADATYGLMSINTIIFIILLKVLIALEVVLPTSLYLAVIVGLGRLYNDNEMTALFASGVSLRRVLTVVFVFPYPSRSWEEVYRSP
jgi:Predicted permeases